MLFPLNEKKYRMVEEIGWGTFGVVNKAIDDSTGTLIAYKKTRTSLRTKRPALRHEARVLQRLQGHPAIPKLLGYQHVVHFEHITMELLGPPLDKLLTSEHAMSSITVLRIGEQLISALQHLFACNIVHRDVKPSNVCVSVENPAQICLIDYGLSLPLSPAAMATVSTKRFDPVEDEVPITGSADWCGLNVHDGMWSRPRDDVESLAYLLFYLYFGRIPWRVDYREEAHRDQMQRVRMAKEAFLRALPLSGIPQPLNDLLGAARASLGNGDIDAPLNRVREDMLRLIASSGRTADTPLDWTPVPIPTSAPPLMDFVKVPYDSTADDRGIEEYLTRFKAGLIPLPDPTEPFANHHMIEWEKVSSRDISLTFPGDEGVLLDSLIPDSGIIEDE